MNSSSPPSLENITHLGLRSGGDMRPTLLRVLTDLYVQKLMHTADEEHQYTELALRLLDSVDTATRAAVATRLARHLSPPRRVIERLAADLPGIAEPVRAHPLLRRSPKAEAPKSPDTSEARFPAAAAIAEPEQHYGEVGLGEEPSQDAEARPAADLNAPIGAAVANELNELFFAANAKERVLILLNLDTVAPQPMGRNSLTRDPEVALRLERAALVRDREDFAEQLAEALRIPRPQALRIATDELGEPLVTVAKALGLPREVVYRLLLFVNTAVGHSVERVHALADLYDDMTTQAAEHMVAIWQALQQTERKEERKEERKPARYQPLLWNDEARVRARTAAATVRRAPSMQRLNDRRDAS